MTILIQDILLERPPSSGKQLSFYVLLVILLPEQCHFSVETDEAEVLLYIHRNRRLLRDSHLDSHTAPEFCSLLSSVLLYVHRNHQAY